MNLLAPDLLAEIYCNIRQDGSFDLYASKFDLPPELALSVCNAFVQIAVQLAKTHGLTLRLGVQEERT